MAWLLCKAQAANEHLAVPLCVQKAMETPYACALRLRCQEAGTETHELF